MAGNLLLYIETKATICPKLLPSFRKKQNAYHEDYCENMGILNILYQSDDTYAEYLGISLTSLLQENMFSEVINIFVLDIGISERNKKRIEETCKKYGRSCVLIDCKDIEEELQRRGIPHYRNSYATYLKLFVKKKLPYSIDKLLYVDCDTIIKGNLEPLFDNEWGFYPLGMIPDALAYQYKRKLGFDKAENYFNAGIILFQFKAWEKQGWDKKLSDFLQSDACCSLAKHDQDIINIVFRGNIAELPTRYNLQSIYYAADLEIVSRIYRDVWPITKECLRKEIINQKILHFLVFNGEAPWNEGSVHPFQAVFNEYKKQSLWAEDKPCKVSLGIFFKIEKYLYVKLPRILFLALFRVVHDLFNLI